MFLVVVVTTLDLILQKEQVLEKLNDARQETVSDMRAGTCPYILSKRFPKVWQFSTCTRRHIGPEGTRRYVDERKIDIPLC